MATVRDIMHTDIISVPPNALIEHALDLMLDNKISGLPVIDEDGKLVGVISEYDALELICESTHDYWPVEPVAGLMTSSVETVEADMPLSDLAHFFHDRTVRRLPVIERGRVVGIVSRRDVIKAIRSDRQKFAKMTLNLTNMLSASTFDQP